MGTSEPVRAPPEVSRTRGHKLARPRSDRIEVAPFRDLRLDDGSWRQDHGIFFPRSCRTVLCVWACRFVSVFALGILFCYLLRSADAVPLDGDLAVGGG